MTKSLLRGFSTCLVLSTSLAFAQTSDTNGAAKPAAMTFEVATIKPAPPLTPDLIASGKLHAGMSVDGARVDIGFFALGDLIRTAYKLKSYQLTGPDFLTGQRFDILAKMPEGATKEQVPEMLQALLADRFKLTSHRDTKEHSVYALVIAKSGLKMKEAGADADAPPPADDGKKGGLTVGAGSNQVRVTPAPDGKGATVSGGGNNGTGPMKMSVGPNGTMHMEFKKMPMEGLVEMVSRFVDRPVVDMTELKGSYEVALDLSLEDMKAMAAKDGVAVGPVGGPGGPSTSAPADAASEPTSSIFTALTAMGLKLESRKAPIEIMVIDHVEKAPTEN
jgi:uncharacterized protein (TIGR03435 family)